MWGGVEMGGGGGAWGVEGVRYIAEFKIHGGGGGGGGYQNINVVSIYWMEMCILLIIFRILN